jgi:hypothetical protein
MNPRFTAILSQIKSRAFLWVLIALYIFLLPDARLVYDAIVGFFGQGIAGKVPLVTVSAFGLAYGVAVGLTCKNLKYLLYLVPCGAISWLIMALVDNPNKHIHIPEYVLMAWLLYAVLSKDIQGGGLYVLVFAFASLLGVVDELEQGIHPDRFYGWSDMLVNSASALIGVFTLLGLKMRAIVTPGLSLSWREIRIPFGVCLFGLVGAGIQCSMLFRVQAAGSFQGIYPLWLLVWNILFLLLATAALMIPWCRLQNLLHSMRFRATPLSTEATCSVHALLIPLLVILLYMHAIAVFANFAGFEFV